jgi:hypothetical protein
MAKFSALDRTRFPSLLLKHGKISTGMVIKTLTAEVPGYLGYGTAQYYYL